MLNHDWTVIIDASSDLLAEAKELGHLLTGLCATPSRTELWIAESVQDKLRGPASAAIFRFTRDIRTNDCNSTIDLNADLLWTIYAGRGDLRLAALRLWRFYADLIQPKLFGPETTWSVVKRNGDDLVVQPHFPPVRSDEEWRSDAIDLVRELIMQASEFEAAVASLRAATENGEASLNDRDAWIYEHVMKVVPYKNIRSNLDRIRGERSWDSISTDNGVKNAAIRYAERTGKPLPEARSPGRRKSEQ